MAETVYASNQNNSALDQLNAGLGIVLNHAGYAVDKWGGFLNARATAKAQEAQAQAELEKAKAPNAVNQWTASVGGESNATILIIGGIVGLTLLGTAFYLAKK